MIKVIGYLLLVLLTGCASDTVNVRYYKLGSVLKNSKTSDLTRMDKNKSVSERPLIIIEPISLADFLRQQGLVIQRTDHQLQISNIHRWAESLESSSSRVIQSHLESHLPGFRFESKNARWKTKPNFRISIELVEFQVNNRMAKVTTSGQFWIFDGDNNLINKEHFLLEESLNENGYEHAISRLEMTLLRLSKLISKTI